MPRSSPDRVVGARIVAGLGLFGDPGVLPVRHSLERARTATRVVPPLSRRVDGAPGGYARSRFTLESARWSIGTTAGPRVAAHPTGAAAGLPVDSGAPRRRTAGAARATVTRSHPALRRDPALGFG